MKNFLTAQVLSILGLLFVGIIQGMTLPANIDKAKIDDGSLYFGLLSRVSRPATVVDSSVNGYTLWTQMHECIGYNPSVDGIQIVNRGIGLNVHQTPGDISFWIHDTLNAPARYPTSIVSDGTINGPHLSFPVLLSPPSWGYLVGQYESGGWWSSFWDPAVDLGPGDLDVHKVIGKQLPDGNILFIGVTETENILYETWTPDLSAEVSSGTLATGMNYWGFDINGGIAYVFYYSDSLYYRTTTDGVTWSTQQTYNMVWPNPYTNNIIGWTQLAVTDVGNPLLVFDNWNGDDTTYPFYSKVYVSYASGQPCVEVSSSFAAPDTECFYPTIATGGNMAAVLYCMPRNNEIDSLNWWDFYVNWSTDNGVTWGTPVNYTQSLTNRPGLQQIAKRIDTLRNRVYYVYAVDMVRNIDPLWHLWFGTGTDPMYICFDYATYVGIEEDKAPNLKAENPKLEIYPNPFKSVLRIAYIVDRSEQKVALRIYDVGGRLVRDFSRLTNYDGRSMSFVWNGTDDLGQEVSNGVYFIHFETCDRRILIRQKIIKLE